MQLDSLSAELIDRALGLYLSIAWPGREAEKLPDLHLSGCGAEALAGFTDESRRDGDRRFVLRLGNSRYAHMKLVIEEYLLPGEYVFAVDTHDQLELKPEYPDYEATDNMRTLARLQAVLSSEDVIRANEIPIER